MLACKQSFGLGVCMCAVGEGGGGGGGERRGGGEGWWSGNHRPRARVIACRFSHVNREMGEEGEEGVGEGNWF